MSGKQLSQGEKAEWEGMAGSKERSGETDREGRLPGPFGKDVMAKTLLPTRLLTNLFRPQNML